MLPSRSRPCRAAGGARSEAGDDETGCGQGVAGVHAVLQMLMDVADEYSRRLRKVLLGRRSGKQIMRSGSSTTSPSCHPRQPAPGRPAAWPRCRLRGRPAPTGAPRRRCRTHRSGNRRARTARDHPAQQRSAYRRSRTGALHPGCQSSHPHAMQTDRCPGQPGLHSACRRDTHCRTFSIVLRAGNQAAHFGVERGCR